jgi:hypothetical protein
VLGRRIDRNELKNEGFGLSLKSGLGKTAAKLFLGRRRTRHKGGEL